MALLGESCSRQQSPWVHKPSLCLAQRPSLLQVHLPPSREAMPALWTICSLLLLSVLCMDLAMAGSSFLSPEHQKLQVRRHPRSPVS